MSVLDSTSSPRPPQGQSSRAQAELGSSLNPGGRGMQQGQARDSNTGQEDRFGRSLQKALALQKLTAPEPPAEVARDEMDQLPVGAAGLAPPLPLIPSPLHMPPAPQAAPLPAEGVAERINRYLRGAEGGQALRQGEGMVVKLPANALGVTEVSVKLRGDVLLVSIGLQAEAAAESGLMSQIALLGQALSIRQPRHAVRVILDDGEDGSPRVDDRGTFNPLFPKGRIG